MLVGNIKVDARLVDRRCIFALMDRRDRYFEEDLSPKLIVIAAVTPSSNLRPPTWYGNAPTTAQSLLVDLHKRWVQHVERTRSDA